MKRVELFGEGRKKKSKVEKLKQQIKSFWHFETG